MDFHKTYRGRDNEEIITPDDERSCTNIVWLVGAFVWLAVHVIEMHLSRSPYAEYHAAMWIINFRFLW